MGAGQAVVFERDQSSAEARRSVKEMRETAKQGLVLEGEKLGELECCCSASILNISWTNSRRSRAQISLASLQPHMAQFLKRVHPFSSALHSFLLGLTAPADPRLLDCVGMPQLPSLELLLAFHPQSA